MKVTFVVVAALMLGTFGVVRLHDGSKDNAFDSDYVRVSNGFQMATAQVVGEVSGVEPDSECSKIDESRWRCYRRWAPVGQPDAVEILEAEVNVYEQRVVVGHISRTPD